MALSDGLSLGSGGPVNKNDHNAQEKLRTMAQRVMDRNQVRSGKPADDGLDYMMPSAKNISKGMTAGDAGLPKTGQAADDYYSAERILKRMVSGAEGSTLGDLDF